MVEPIYLRLGVRYFTLAATNPVTMATRVLQSPLSSFILHFPFPHFSSSISVHTLRRVVKAAGNPSPQRLCLLPSASPSPTVSLQLPTKTSALKPSPCLCCPDCSALPCDPRGAYHVEFTWRLGEVGLKCFENQASGFVKYR